MHAYVLATIINKTEEERTRKTQLEINKSEGEDDVDSFTPHAPVYIIPHKSLIP